MNLLQSMNYEEFLDQVRTMAEHRTGGEAQVTIRPILKNNNLRRWQQLAGPVPVNIKAKPDAERIMISWRLDDE